MINTKGDKHIKFYFKNSTLYFIYKDSSLIKISTSVSTYCYFIDSSNILHICYTDIKSNLFYCIYKNSSLIKNNICNLPFNKKTVKSIKIYVYNN
ncbi:MAG: hypothetical protein ACRCXT_13995, partial [Paraclostridium sp.]